MCNSITSTGTLGRKKAICKIIASDNHARLEWRSGSFVLEGLWDVFRARLLSMTNLTDTASSKRLENASDVLSATYIIIWRNLYLVASFENWCGQFTHSSPNRAAGCPQ